ncbi:MAG: hypothetical protein ACI87A_003366 [Planctomycetota bacterium]|jgi:hypothetical protein
MKRLLTTLLVLFLVTAINADDGESQGPTLADARQAVAKNDFVGATMLLEVVTAREPKNAQAWQLLGFSLHSQRRFEEALKAHTTAAGFKATAGIGAYNAACACAMLERADDAIAWLTKAQQAGHDISAAKTDPDLKSIQKAPAFANLFPNVLAGSASFVENPRVLHTLDGEAAGDQFGWVARAVDDLDQDGVLDFAATAPTHASKGPASGRVYVYSGRSAKLLFTMDGSPGQLLGSSVGPAGDVNADGTPDIFAGAPGSGKDGQSPGNAYVYSGKDGSLLLSLSAAENNDGFGTSVCSLGDLNKDGHSDLFVGAISSGKQGSGSGAGYVYSGKEGVLLFSIPAESAGATFGSAAACTRGGEPNLLVIGSMTAGPKNTGRAYVYGVSDQGAELRFTILGDDTSSNLGQYFVAIAGDVDNDGTKDIYASDFNNGALGSGTGRVFVHSGRTGESILTLTGSVAGEGFGTSPSNAGDVNRDGHADFIVGAWQHSSAAPSGGRCYLLSGKDGSQLATYTCKQAGDTLGFDAVGIGDVDGDGGIDFLLTSAWSPVHGRQTGRVFVIAGPTFE